LFISGNPSNLFGFIFSCLLIRQPFCSTAYQVLINKAEHELWGVSRVLRIS